ncbi:MAG: phospholipase [Taibaiella sp.]|nr:phospholipase [Taibaiella sp.]
MAKMRNGKPAAYSEHNTVKVIRGGADYFQELVAIASSATSTLHIQTYIYDEDETGLQVAEAFMAAARRGVQVYMLLDSYASQSLSSAFIARLREAGIHFRFFEPFLHSRRFYFGRRLHHKIVVADAKVCMVGGLNISNRYNDMPGVPAWLDWALVVNGDAAKRIEKVCVRIWNKKLFVEKCAATSNIPQEPHSGSIPVRISRNDWVNRLTGVTDSYKELFALADKEVTIMTSYFWPPRGLLRRMEAAARRGVKIKIILTGYADVPFAKYAERYLYNRLFRSRIQVYEYTRNVLHGKIAIRDNEWITVGSYNLNNISAFVSVELNLDVMDKAVATKLAGAVQVIMEQDCTLITPQKFEASNNILKMFFYYLSYRIIQALYFLFTFYFSQRTKA